MNTLKYIPEIDGLRGLAVLGVILFHLDLLSGGFLGVDVFFVISGYLITQIITSENERKIFSLKNFYIKRFKRLFPALLFVSLLSIFFGAIILDPESLTNLNLSSLTSILFTSNIFFWLESNYFDEASNLKPLLHTWSLGIEMTFYLIFPALFIFLNKKMKNESKIFFFVILILLSIASILFVEEKKPVFETKLLNGLFYGKYVDDTLFYLFPFRFFEFLFGSIVALLPQKKFEKFNSIFFNASILIIVFCFFLFDNKTNYLFRTLTTCFLTSFIIYFKKNSFSFLLSNHIILKIGLISYSLYLIHWPIIVFSKYYIFGQLDLFQKIIIFILSLLISQISFNFIEKPLRQKYDVRQKKMLSSIIFVFLLLFISTYISEGFKFRMDKNNIQKVNTLNKDKAEEFCEAQFSKNNKVKEKICLYGSEKDAKIVIMGDSNGTMWFPGFKEIGIKNNFSIVSYSRSCNNFPHLNFYPEINFNNCDEINLENKILVIGAQWFNYQNSNDINSLAKGFAKNISKLYNNNQLKNFDKIIIMGQIPNYLKNLFDIKTCFSRPQYLKDIKCVEYFNDSLNENDFLDEIKEFNSLLFFEIKKTLGLNKDRLLFINPIEFLCETNCVQFIEKKIVYMDGNHISSDTSKYIINKNFSTINNFINN